MIGKPCPKHQAVICESYVTQNAILSIRNTHLDGHCKDEISKKLSNLDKIEKPVIINFLTKKGNGVKYMEDDPIEWHYKTIN